MISFIRKHGEIHYSDNFLNSHTVMKIREITSLILFEVWSEKT